MNKNNNPILNGDSVLEGDKPTTTSKAVNKIVVVALLLIALSLGLMLRWATQSTQVLDIKNSPFPVRTIREHPTPDGIIILTVDFCKNQNIDGITRTSFVSSNREVFLPVYPERGPKGCQKVEIPVVIPKNIYPDTYKIKFTTTYDINPLKRGVVQEFESQPVTIVAPGGAGSERLAPTP